MRTARRIKTSDLKIGDVLQDRNGVPMKVVSITTKKPGKLQVELALGDDGDLITLIMASQRLVTTWDEGEVRTPFRPLERLTTDLFDLVKLDKEVKITTCGPTYLEGTWTLQYGGRIWFALPNGLPKATVDFSEEEVAAMFFDNLLSVRTKAVQLGYATGRATVQTELKQLLGITSEDGV